MQLNSLLEQISYESVLGSHELMITDLAYHSGNVKEGSLFLCIRGLRADGHDYILQAVRGGAAAVVVEASCLVYAGQEVFLYTDQQKIELSRLIHNGVTVVAVKNTRTALYELSAAFFGNPSKKLTMIGITGTKGKTTTAFLTAGILREAGYRMGVIGTIWIDTGKEIITADHTTPESCDIQRYLAQMVENGCDGCVMEVSSQGIKMQRTAGIFFDIGVFLNIEPDHIGAGEHASFSEYLYCKGRLMRQCRVGIVNRDDPNVEKILIGHTCAVETFSAKGISSLSHSMDVTAGQTSFYMIQGKLYSCFQIRRGNGGCLGSRRKLSGTLAIQMQLPGMFNVDNALAAAAVASHFHVSDRQLERALRTAVVPGRCENTGISQEYVCLIDYAHNEMSLRNLLLTLRSFAPRRLVVLFGCGGNRSPFRRSRMGETAGHLADFSILTTDNPRWEDPERILDDIEDGIRGTGGAYVRIADRRAAVEYAVAQAQPGDILVLAGKGHEGYQEICGVKYPMSEQELAASAVRKQKEKTET